MNNSSFIIQCAHVEIRQLENRQFDKIMQVFPKLFWENQEAAYLFWNNVPIRFHYRYELFANFDEVLAVCWMMQKEESGSTKATIQTDYFIFDWVFRWQGEKLEMSARFTARRKCYAAYASALNNAPDIFITKEEFLNEWSTLFQQIFKCFTNSGVIINDGAERRKYELMIGVIHKMESYGKLYTKNA